MCLTRLQNRGLFRSSFIGPPLAITLRMMLFLAGFATAVGLFLLLSLWVAQFTPDLHPLDQAPVRDLLLSVWAAQLIPSGPDAEQHEVLR